MDRLARPLSAGGFADDPVRALLHGCTSLGHQGQQIRSTSRLQTLHLIEYALLLLGYTKQRDDFEVPWLLLSPQLLLQNESPIHLLLRSGEKSNSVQKDII